MHVISINRSTGINISKVLKLLLFKEADAFIILSAMFQ